LSSSEHLFPFKLKKLGFNSNDLSQLLFFNEISPRDGYDLLVKDWGVGERLAICLLSVYGGHVYNISKAINELAISSENFTAPLSPSATSDIITILKNNKGFIENSRNINSNSDVVKALKSLAEKGFYAIEEYSVSSEVESLEEQFSRLNIAGVVYRHSIVPGLSEEVWKGQFDFSYASLLLFIS
jgi:hypothetical protein